MSQTEGREAIGADAVRVVSGNPTDDELAAVIAVLASVAADAPVAGPPPASQVSAWARSQRPLRSWRHDATWG